MTHAHRLHTMHRGATVAPPATRPPATGERSSTGARGPRGNRRWFLWVSGGTLAAGAIGLGLAELGGGSEENPASNGTGADTLASSDPTTSPAAANQTTSPAQTGWERRGDLARLADIGSVAMALGVRANQVSPVDLEASDEHLDEAAWQTDRGVRLHVRLDPQMQQVPGVGATQDVWADQWSHLPEGASSTWSNITTRFHGGPVGVVIEPRGGHIDAVGPHQRAAAVEITRQTAPVQVSMTEQMRLGSIALVQGLLEAQVI